MCHQFNIQQFCFLPTLYLCVLCGSQNKQRLFPYTALTDWFYNRDGVCLLRGTDWVFKCDRYSFVLKGFSQVINTFTATPWKAVLIQYLILMAVKLQIGISWVIIYWMQKISVASLSELSITTNTIVTITFKFIFICIPKNPEMVTNFNTKMS